MKKPAILLLVAATLATSYFFIHRHFIAKESSHERYGEREEEEREGEGEEEEQQSGAARQLNGWFVAKAYPEPENLSAKYQQGWIEHQALITKTKEQQSTYANRIGSASNWAGLGYCVDGSTRIGGRIVCMAIDPNNSNNLWVGSASGGIWKSTDAGSNWTSVTTNLPVLGVSSILVDPSNSQIIYAGTGEVYHTEVGVMGYNVWKARGTYGIGVIKSTNGGGTWTQVMTKTPSDLFAIQSMAFLPGNSNTIFACATDGLHRSTDGGANWTKIYTGVNVRDVAINPSNTSEIVISVGNMTNSTKGIFKSTNGLAATPTWTAATGLPAYQGHIKIDNVGAGLMVASVGVSSSSANSEVYRSTDFGSTWTSLASTNHCSYQFWFAHTVAINPFATDSLMFGGVNLYRYRISNTTRTVQSDPHADHHDIKFDPVYRGRIYICNDGGVYKSTNGGVSFTAINNGLNATQFYPSLGVSRSSANRMIGGLQDNGQVLYNGTNWTTPSGGGGDGTSCAIHPTNQNIMLASRDARQIFRSSNGSSFNDGAVTSYWGFVGDSRTGFVAPIAFAPSDGNIVYQASDNIHISNNAGASFTNNALGSTPPYPATSPSAYIEQRHKTAIALAVSPTNSSKIYVSTSPFAQADNDVNTIYVNGQPNVFKTTTPATTPYTSIKGSLPDRFVMDFAISRFNDDSVYVVLGGFGTSHVYLTANGGTSWTSVGTGLPDVPLNAVLIDPVNPRTIYVGSDFGVYVSPNRGQTWYSYNDGFTDATMVYDLQVDANNKLIAATHGKGVFRSDLFIDNGTLPVTLISFTGTGHSGYNRLKWTVAQEDNLSHYELERSASGSSFDKVATVQARDSHNETTYEHTDNTQLFESYYRLKMVDRDGSFKYSSVIFIRKDNGVNTFAVAGNPFTDNIVLKYTLSRDKKINVQLLNSAGATVKSTSYAVTAGQGNYTIHDLGNYPAGMYILNILYDDKKTSIKLVKK